MSRKKNRKHRTKNSNNNASNGPRENATSQGPDENHSNEINAKNQKDKELTKLSNRWQWDLMTVLTAILAGGTIITFVLLWIQLEDSRENFTKDQRPYLWQSNIKPLQAQAGQKMYMNIYMANYGKSPAMQVFGTGKVFYGKNALQQADEFFTRLGDKKLPYTGGTVTIIPPGIPSDPLKTPNYTTVLSDLIPTADDLAFILNNDFAIVAVAREQYEDISGNTYQTDLCFFRFGNGSIGQCASHNKMK